MLSTIYRPQAITEKEKIEIEKQIEKEKLKEVVLVGKPPVVTKAEASEIEFRIALANKIHSAWSAIYAFKNIVYLHESDHIGGGGRDYLKLLTRRDILYSIVHHTTEEPKDEVINRFQFILLIIDDIEEALRYGRGGKKRGLIANFCDLKWEVNNDLWQILLDYSDYPVLGKSKYEELLKKYQAQINYKNTNYVIELAIKDKKYYKTMRLNLLKD